MTFSSYAKVSKRVNIQRLKQDIWKNIKDNLMAVTIKSDKDNDSRIDNCGVNENNISVDENISTTTTTTTTTTNLQKSHQKQQQTLLPHQNTLSFQQMICQIASNNSNGSMDGSNKDVTLPFYFICLLHLANEHVSIYCFCVTNVQTDFILFFTYVFIHNFIHFHTEFED